jgi:hypothetical protein
MSSTFDTARAGSAFSFSLGQQMGEREPDSIASPILCKAIPTPEVAIPRREKSASPNGRTFANMSGKMASS